MSKALPACSSARREQQPGSAQASLATAGVGTWPVSPAQRRVLHRARGFVRALGDGADDRGSAVETAVIFPFLIVMTFAIVQAGIWFHARGAALNAAEEGLQAARAHNGSAAAAQAASDSFLRRAGNGSVLNPSTQVQASATTITVSVSAQSTSIVSFLPLPPFTQSVSGAAERFTTS